MAAERSYLPHATRTLGHAVQVSLDPQERPRVRDGGAVGAGDRRDGAGKRS